MCRQLQDNPDVDGNQRQIKIHKRELQTWNDELGEELQKDLKFETFASNLVKELEKQQLYDNLRKLEKDLNLKIKKIEADERQKKDEAAKQTHEDNLDIAEKKRTVNETEVEAKLHLQYYERKIEGDQSCRDRLYRKEEQKLENQINQLKQQLGTEELVTKTIRKHLQTKQTELVTLTKSREVQRDKEGQELEAEKEKIKNMRQTALEEFEECKRLIAEDDDYRERLTMIEKGKEEQENEKHREKMSMDQAARFIQRKWTWF